MAPHHRHQRVQPEALAESRLIRHWWGIVFNALALLLCTCSLPGCTAAANIQNAPAQRVAIQVSPSTTSLIPGESLQFEATVVGMSNVSITWSVSGTSTVGVGTISQAGLYIAPTNPAAAMTVTVVATSVSDPTQSGTASISVSPVAPSQAATLYGPAIQFDVLNNAQVAQGDVDYRIRAARTGPVSSFVWYDAYVEGGATAHCSGSECKCDGYGCGTGGTIEACLYTDDGTAQHLPTDPLTQQSTGLRSAPLSCVMLANLRTGAVIRKETFPTPPQLVSGTLYHLHWHNSDPDPGRNFVSVDDSCVWHPSSPRQPGISDVDLGVLSIYNNGTKIVANSIATDTPIFQINYSDGSTQGQGYIESWNVAAVDISGSSAVREFITVSGTDRIESGLAVRVNRVSGNSPLTITLATDTGEVIDQGEISSQTFPSGPPLSSDGASSVNINPAWGLLTFSSPFTLRTGESYQIILTAPGNTRYQDYGIEKGRAYGFSPEAFFADGYAQSSADGGESWNSLVPPGGGTGGQNADIQFYFIPE